MNDTVFAQATPLVARPPLVPQSISVWIDHIPTEFDDYYIEIRSKHTRLKNPVSGKALTVPKRFPIGELRLDPESADAYAQKKVRDGYEVYFIRNPIDKRNYFAKDSDVKAVCSMALDIDYVLPPDALPILESLGLPLPNVTVCSGRGTHAYWRILPLGFRQGSNALFRFVTHWKSQFAAIDVRCKNVSRILRYPGTANFKDLEKEQAIESYLVNGLRTHIHGDTHDTVYALSDLIPGLSTDDNERITMEDMAYREPRVGAIHRTTLFDPLPLGALDLDPSASSAASFSSLAPAPSPLRVCPMEQSNEERVRKEVPLRECSRREVEGLDLDFIDMLIERHKVAILKAGERTNRRPYLVNALRKHYTTLTDGQLALIHGRYWERWGENTSGEHDEESSCREFIACWNSLPRSKHHAEWMAEMLPQIRPHPRRAEVHGDEATLADWIYTGCESQGGTCYLSCRVAGEIIGKKRDTASRVLRSLVKQGLIAIAVGDDGMPMTGSKVTGKATYYTVPGIDYGAAAQKPLLGS